jgi:hypothetical protein
MEKETSKIIKTENANRENDFTARILTISDIVHHSLSGQHCVILPTGNLRFKIQNKKQMIKHFCNA